MKKLLFPFVLLSLSLSGCSSSGSSKGNPEPPAPPAIEERYEYVDYKDGIKLTNHISEYQPVVRVPTSIDGKKVVAIGTGCFKKNNTNQKRAATTDEEPSTYTIDSSVEEIEEGAFDEDSTFFTDGDNRNEGWNDSSMTGSATDNEGNVYYDTNDRDVVHEEGIVYSKTKKEDAYYLARCLTKRKTVNIASEINGMSVVYVGDKSFYNNRHIETVNFPVTIGTIYSYAFKGCSSLKEINFNSPNLSIIKTETFSDCTSLDVVRFPENITKIMSKVLSNCGTLSVVYLPATLVNIADDVFYNTTVKKIVFSGSQEKWDNIMDLCHCDNVRQIPVECLDTAGTSILNDVTELKYVPDGTKIQVRGILCGYSRYKKNKYTEEYQHEFAMIRDKNSNYSVVGYNGFAYDLAMVYDPSWIGREVECTGDKGIFYGNLQIVNIQFQLTEDETIYDISASNYNWDEFDASKHVGEYIHYEGRYLGSGGTNFENLPIDVTYFSISYPSLSKTVKVNDIVSFNFWVAVYNQTYQAFADMNSAVIIE